MHSQKQAIQAEPGDLAESLEWERIDAKRASRIALYHKGAITDNKEALADLNDWAVEAMGRFQPVMEKYVRALL